MRKVSLGPYKERIPVLGQGTYGIFSGDAREIRERWKKSLSKGIELGMTHLDTAEMYGSGASERLVGEVIAEHDREELFITTKVLPSRTSIREIKNAAKKSLERLGVDEVDLYLIHWLEEDSSIPTIMEALEELVNEGMTRYIGVSNFSVEEFKEASSCLRDHELVTNQVKINVERQEEIWRNLKFYQKQAVLLTAYTPLAKAHYASASSRIQENMKRIAETHGTTLPQVALAWVLSFKHVVAIPRSSNPEHVEQNARAAEIRLTKEEITMLADLDVKDVEDIEIEEILP